MKIRNIFTREENSVCIRVTSNNGIETDIIIKKTKDLDGTPTYCKMKVYGTEYYALDAGIAIHLACDAQIHGVVVADAKECDTQTFVGRNGTYSLKFYNQKYYISDENNTVICASGNFEDIRIFIQLYL